MSTSYSESSQARDSGVNEELLLKLGKRKERLQLFGTTSRSLKIFLVVVDNASSNDSMMRKLREWLLKDSLIPLNGDLLHLRYLNKSPSATQKFDTALRHCNLEGKRNVAMDVPNRWNSTYLLLEMALPLKEAFCRLQRIGGHYQFEILLRSHSSLQW
ncbi:hypothetical protein BUALT_Bualt16G0077600 [Buddleja alternifolia]|uniref:Uncharacterized protein n=1 Tax=Buddleja alternifolia TaxID=168488 RepID=A0AAV6WG91_9LAMI|nr:hypothetical protein BUALT_Bualt16G0077600 [Buddleja alternifolia]